jgi:hypothetical protein
MSETTQHSERERLQLAVEAEVKAIFDGRTHFQGDGAELISVGEESVFDIHDQDMPRLIVAYKHWVRACGVRHTTILAAPRMRKALLAELPMAKAGRDAAIARGPYSDEFIAAWMEFASLFSIPRRHSRAFMWKRFFYFMRTEGKTYDDGYFGIDQFGYASLKDYHYDPDAVDETPF